MTFDDLTSSMNESLLSVFGKEFTFTRVASLEDDEEAVPETITGILEAGIEPEDIAPGDGSTYARLWLQSGDISPVPQKGDEVSSSTTVYKIVRMEEDAAGGLWMLLRQDRAVT
jgi:hypothetical protein